MRIASYIGKDEHYVTGFAKRILRTHPIFRLQRCVTQLVFDLYLALNLIAGIFLS